MKNITGIISLLGILLFHNLGLAQNDDILPFNQGTFFSQTIQLRQGIGVGLSALAISPDGRKIVVAGNNSNTVSIIDMENNNVIAIIPVGDWPAALAITPDGRKAMVANSGSTTVSIIDMENNNVIATIPVGNGPWSLAITPDGRKAVVGNYWSGTVSIIDLDNSGVIKNIKVEILPIALAITPDGSRVLVVNRGSQSISIVGEIGTITLSDEVINITKADETFTVTATVYDTVGKPVKDVPIIFTSTNPNIVLVERGAVTDANGKASIVLTPLRKGTANLFAQFEGLRSNLTTVHVTQDIEIIPLPVSDKPFSVLVTVISDFTGCRSIARVTVLDAYGDPIPNAEVEINLAIKARTNEEGVAEVELCLGGEGGLSATVSATAAGVESEKILFDFSSDTPQPIEEITFGSASISLTEGDPILGGRPFLLTARVSPPQAGVKVNFFSTDPRVAEVVGRSGVTDSNGEATIPLLPKVAGSCELIAQASRFVSQPIPVEVEKIRVSEVQIEDKTAAVQGGGGGQGKVMGMALPTAGGAGPIQPRSQALIETKRARLYANDGEAGSIITASVFPPQEGVEVRFTIDRPEVASVEIRTFTDARGIATARVDFISKGEATITAHVMRAPTSNPSQEKAVRILPPSVLGSVIEAISRMGMDGARVSILEEPERGAMTTTGGGSFWIQAIRRAHASFKVEAEGYFNRVEQIDLLSLPEQVVFPLTQDKFGNPVLPPPSGPDLTGSWGSGSPARSCKQSKTRLTCSLKGTFTVQNQGTQTAPKSLLKFYRSDDTTLDESDSLLKQIAIGALKPGKAQKKTFSAKLPAGSSASGQFIIAVVDAGDALKESNETNNTIISEPLP